LANFDTSVPALLFKIGKYPLAHGVLGAVRSLGQTGVPVYAITEGRTVPQAFSRYLRRSFVLPTTGREPEEQILDHLRDIGRQLGTKAVLFATDDEAAVFAAEHAQSLRDHFLLPPVDPKLPRLLTSKRHLSDLCRQHAVPTPATMFARSIGDVFEFADVASFPIVVKNSDPWKRITSPAVKGTTLIGSKDELVSLAGTWTDDPEVILQECIPTESAEDWIVHAYLGADALPLVAFTGFKMRSWPVRAGVTTAAAAVQNEPLLAQAMAFCCAAGYRGIVDMDWRFDRRDGRYKLVDFNPRLGANFRLFETDAAIDVVRAAHLDLTGRPVPDGRQMFNRLFTVENLDFASRLCGPRCVRFARRAGGGTERAWFSARDPAPFAAMAVRFGSQTLVRVLESIVPAGRLMDLPRRRGSRKT
jgi:predicted ATP-grasp superfamily ATP-dependent carboligase